MGNVVVDVMLKPEILDPQGQAVAGALPAAGLRRVHRRAPGQALRPHRRRRGHRRATSPRPARRPRRCCPTPSSRTSSRVRDAGARRDAREDRGRHLPRLARRPRRPARAVAGRRRPRRSPSGTATPTCAASTRSSCPAASPTATTCAAAPSPASRRSWTRSSPAARGGLPVLGICNGFQVLCESHLLPGALIRNDHRKFICSDQVLRVENASTAWTSDFERGPGDHHRPQERRGRLRRRRARRSTSSRARAGSSSATSASNPNGSYRDIAGITNERGNVVGLMPHPEHASRRATARPPTGSASSPPS